LRCQSGQGAKLTTHVRQEPEVKIMKFELYSNEGEEERIKFVGRKAREKETTRKTET
jgi:hypothetical protein